MKKLKCESCGAKLKVDEDGEYATCEYCGSKYKMKEDININFEMDENMKKMFSFKNQADSVRNNARLGAVVFAVFIVFFVTVCIFNFGMFDKTKDGIENGIEIGIENEINNKNNIIQQQEDIVDEYKISSFNTTYEMYKGTTSKFHINSLLDKVGTNNKKSNEHIINVEYNGKNVTSEEDIINIKYELNDDKKYEVILDYDEIGFINKVTIKDIK